MADDVFYFTAGCLLLLCAGLFMIVVTGWKPDLYSMWLGVTICSIASAMSRATVGPHLEKWWRRNSK